MLIFTDLEPDDVAMLIMLKNVELVNVVIGVGDVHNKMCWMQRLVEEFPIMNRWKFYAGTETDAYFPPCPIQDSHVPLFGLDNQTLDSLIRANQLVVSSKPVTELLALPEGTVFEHNSFFATMSFNFRSAAKDLDADAKRLISMFPSLFVWVESFPAIGSANADFFALKSKTAHEIQVAWNTHLLADQIKSLSSSVDKLEADPSALDKHVATLKRKIKCVQQISASVDKNILLVDCLLVPLIKDSIDNPEFQLTQVEFVAHDSSGYPQFKESKEGNLFVARNLPHLRARVAQMMSNV